MIEGKRRSSTVSKCGLLAAAAIIIANARYPASALPLISSLLSCLPVGSIRTPNLHTSLRRNNRRIRGVIAVPPSVGRTCGTLLFWDRLHRRVLRYNVRCRVVTYLSGRFVGVCLVFLEENEAKIKGLKIGKMGERRTNLGSVVLVVVVQCTIVAVVRPRIVEVVL